MDVWIDELAAELGEDSLAQEEVERLLDVAREVAHRVERKITPLAAFLLGSVIGRAEASGMDRARAMGDALATLERLLPPAQASPDPTGVSPDSSGPADPEETSADEPASPPAPRTPATEA